MIDAPASPRFEFENLDLDWLGMKIFTVSVGGSGLVLSTVYSGSDLIQGESHLRPVAFPIPPGSSAEIVGHCQCDRIHAANADNRSPRSH